jgi:predicted DNA-binding transcriptional regulator AlpA
MSPSPHLPEQPVQARRLPAQPTKRYLEHAPCRVYGTREICERFQISRRTFFNWKREQRLPLIEVRIGRTIRYQALPIDRVLAGRGR